MAPELPRSNAPTAPPPGPFGSDAVVVVNHTEGTLSRRFFAYLVDLVMILLFSALLCLAIAIIGLLTFGLGWSLFAIVPSLLHGSGGWRAEMAGVGGRPLL